ncbi:winged-helix domain-containing protein [Cohnella sp.]|uniref:winged helix-turn-helix transcriptional regulator n=1 Tax=Cohnella sp. TaxID=1883426 RepID=UPI00356154D9
MPEYEQVHSLNETLVIQDSLTTPIEPFDGDYCEITNRILIVSPRPASLRTLVAELAKRCYDVLLLHHADDPLLSMVQGTIIIMDRTGEVQAQPALNKLPNDGVSRILALMHNESSAPLNGEEWVKWPCPIEQIIAKIQLLALKNPAVSDELRTLTFKKISLDPGRMIVTHDGTRVDLTKTEFDLLKAIITAKGNVLSRQELMTAVWGEQYFGGSNAVDVHIRSLRRKLDDDPKVPRYIATVRGAGYRLADQ